MCVTLEPAVLSSTILLAHQVEHEGKPVNVMGYQNHAVNRGKGPNAMVLPIPSAVAMSQSNCIDMTGAEKLFREYEGLIRPQSRGLSKGTLKVFDSGSYTVLLTNQNSLLELREAMENLPSDKHINLDLQKAKMFSAFQTLYPDWYLAICIWNGEIEAEPILWWYEPKEEFKDHHFLPGLDAHNGSPPDPGLLVPVDHTIIVGTTPTRYPNAQDLVGMVPSHLHKWLPTHVSGGILHNQDLRNGDWVIPKNQQPSIRVRVPPPGYSAT